MLEMDKRTKKLLADLIPAALQVVTRMLEIAYANGLNMQCHSCYRSSEDQNKLYASILQYRKQLEINESLMNLHEPLLSEENKELIDEVLDSPQQSMNNIAFLKLYNEDMLGGSIANPQMWLHDTFAYLKAYKKKVG